jgi:hypothetical protein
MSFWESENYIHSSNDALKELSGFSTLLFTFDIVSQEADQSPSPKMSLISSPESSR